MFKGKTGFPQDALSSLTLAAPNLNVEDPQMMCIQKEWGGAGTGHEGEP